MDVTRSNFEQVLPIVKKAIDGATFLSFDCELTGLGEYDQFPILSYDLPEVIYHQFLMRSQSFNICQFGLCCFQYCGEDETEFTYQAFNFSIFNRPLNLGLRIQDKYTEYFSCQASSLDFLASQNFDFNKWIREGIGYLGETERYKLEQEVGKVTEKRLREAENLAKKKPREPNIPEEEKPALNLILKQIKAMMADTDQNSIEFNNLSRYQRKLLYGYLQFKYGAALFVESLFPTSDVRESVLVVKQCTPACSYNKLVLESSQHKMDEIDRRVGFCRLLQIISESKKPMVGHNVFLDLMHVLKIFENGYMNEKIGTFASFTKELCNRFPTIYDSKVLAQEQPLKTVLPNTTLNLLYDLVKLPPFRQARLVAADSDSAKYGDPSADAKFHEAGYDAFTTGCIFIAQAQYFADFKKKLAFERFEQHGCTMNSSLLAPFKNKVSIGKVLDLPYFHLSGNNVIPDRSHILVLQLPSDSYSHSDVIKMFEKIGFVKISWIDHTTCFVDLSKPEKASIAQLKFLDNAHNDAARGAAAITLTSCYEYLTKRSSGIVHSSSVVTNANKPSAPSPPSHQSDSKAVTNAMTSRDDPTIAVDRNQETDLQVCSTSDVHSATAAVVDVHSAVAGDSVLGSQSQANGDITSASATSFTANNKDARSILGPPANLKSPVIDVPTSILVDLTTDEVCNAVTSVHSTGFDETEDTGLEEEVEPEPC